MRRMFAFWFLLGVPSALLAQAPTKPSFMKAGMIQHQGTAGTLTANDPRPLMRAIATISQEYGWTVDFEDPPYRSHFDLVDDTDPVWRAIHPNAKGVTRVSGGVFQSNSSNLRPSPIMRRNRSCKNWCLITIPAATPASFPFARKRKVGTQ
jgi:hypothetical protein